MTKTIPFKFSLLPGDLINALPGMREVCRKMNRKADIYLGLNIEWKMTDQVAAGRISKVTLTEKTMEMLKPLLLSQPWINKVESLEVAYPEKYHAWCDAFSHDFNGGFEQAQEWYNKNQDAIIDLDKHHVLPIKLQFSNIFRWNFYVYHDMTCDLSKQWLEVDKDPTMPSDVIIVNRTKRSQNETINYRFLKKYESRLLFAGYPDEWVDFCTMYDLKMPRLEIKDFKDLAIAINSCSFFIGNQSLCFSIAEALKIPRILEVCPYLPNVIPCGELAYDVYFQSCLESIVEYLASKSTGYNGDPYSQIE